ncbi:hypothetical protein NEOLEDRAFT_1241043 [Neolentinus lepideus HHB14362 ss-1]|uniref:Elongin-A n=1 Tax=Neolentinus lepideus HHB14362 ss-1 TaxID=1314782 RepID=A0A165TFH9_9AGAM|nr:hypothetical protein NEOLEDRAFT_1241043 [Neolentinus lepideus HHB14362 ss-1]
MLSDNDQQPCRRILSLVHYCQRVASNHVDSISTLGDLRYDLIKPILGGCTPETLVRLEEASPHIQDETSDIWRQLCFRKHNGQCVERYTDEEPDSWRDQFFLLEEEQAKRLEEVGSRIRSQRQQAEERKKESRIKITDRLPPSKRTRTWGPSQPKTLFQKTKSSASRIQKSMYGPPMLPPMPSAKTYRVLPTPSRSSLLPAPTSTSGTPRITVTVVRRPSTSSVPATGISPTNSAPVSHPSVPTSPPPTSSSLPARTETARTVKPTSKKDPMSNLFMPKHRQHSQLPRQPMTTPINK